MEMKVSEDHDLTLGKYFEIMERDINKITNAVSRRLKVDTSIESKKLEKLEIVSFIQNYVREYTEKKDLIFELKFEIDEEAFLDSEWPEWTTSCAAIESSAGISLKKNQLAYRTATIKAEGTVPEMLEQIMRKLEEM